MKRTFRLGGTAIGVAIAVLVPASPAHALTGSGVYACGEFESSVGIAYRSTHQAHVAASGWTTTATSARPPP